MKKFEIALGVLVVLMAGFASAAIPSPGHRASSVGGDNNSERTFYGSSSDSYLFPGPLVILGNLLNVTNNLTARGTINATAIKVGVNDVLHAGTSWSGHLSGTGSSPTVVNTAGLSYTNITNDPWVEDSQEGSLNVNSSQYCTTNLSCTDCLGETQVQDIYVLNTGDTIDGDLTVNGNLTIIGNYVNATVENQYLNGSFLPSLNDLFNIGSVSQKWKEGYFGTVNATNLYGNLNASYIQNEPWVEGSESDLNINSSDYWDNLGVPSDLNNKILLAAENITAGTFSSGNFTFQDNLVVAGDLNVTGSSYFGTQAFVNIDAAGNIDAKGNLSINNSVLFVNRDTGMVGIGTTSPAAKLSVVDGSVRIENTSGTDANWELQVHDTPANSLHIWGGAEGTETDRLVIDESGKVGINTTSPTQTLTVAGDLNVTGTSYLGDLEISADEIKVNNIQSKDGNITFKNSTGSEIVRMTDSGSVGIGTTNPSSGLEIFNSGDSAITITGNTASGNNVSVSFKRNAGAIIAKILSESEIANDRGNLRFYTTGASGSVERVRIDSAGNIGIGTTSPGVDLQIADDMFLSTGAWPTLKINNSASESASRILLHNDMGVGMNIEVPGTAAAFDYPNETMIRVDNKLHLSAGGKDSRTADLTIDSSGNVGIGTTSPSYELDIVKSEAGNFVDSRLYNSESANSGSGARQIVQVNGSSAGDPRFILSVRAVQEWYLGMDNSDSDKFQIGTSSVPGSETKLTIDTSGNVGIGTTSPAYTLHVNGSGADTWTALETNDSYDAGVLLRQDGSIYWQLMLDDSNANAFSIYDANGTLGHRLVIDQDGNVGINTTTPTQTLTVAGDLNVTGSSYLGDLEISADEIKVNKIMVKDAAFLNISNVVFVNETSGNVGIGTSSPNQTLVVVGNVNITSGDLVTDDDSFTFWDSMGGSWMGIEARGINLGDWDTNPSYGEIITGDYDFNLMVNDTTRFFIESNNGNIGVGMTNPNATLHVDGDINVTSGNDVCIEGGNCLSSSGGSMSSWTLTADSGSSQTVDNGETVDIEGGTDGIDTSVGATNTVTITFDSSELATDDINESKINFNTSCVSGNHLYIADKDLACEADDDNPEAGDVFWSDLTDEGTLGGDNITDGTIDASEIAADAVGSSELASGAVTAAGTELESTVGGNGVIVNSGALDFDCSDVVGTDLDCSGETILLETTLDSVTTINSFFDSACAAGNYATQVTTTGGYGCTADDDNPEAGDVFWSDLTDEGTLGGDNITDGTIDASEIAADAITNSELAANSVDLTSDALSTAYAGEGIGGGGASALNFDCNEVAGVEANGIGCSGEDLFFDCSGVAGTGMRCDSEDLNVYSLSASDGSPDDVVYVDAAGNVGIGTTSPSEKLTVIGNVNVTGNVVIGVASPDPDAKLHIESSASNSIGVYSYVSGSSSIGVRGYGISKGVYGLSTDGDGVYGESTNGYAGYFDGKGYFSGNVGIGATSPNSKLEVAGKLNVSVTSGGAATIGSSGNSATGDYAVAMGQNTNASGDSSTAMGSSTRASGIGSTAMGVSTLASGDDSIAMGYFASVSGTGSIAMGYLTSVSGSYSTAMGHTTNASGTDSTAMGWLTNASGGASTAMGYSTTASGDYSTAMGRQTTARGDYSTAMGREIEASGQYSVAIALNDQNGLDVTQANTMAIMGGNVGIGTASPRAPLDINKNPTAGTPWIGQLYIAPSDNSLEAGISLNTTRTDTDRIWTIMAGTGGGTPNTHLRIVDVTAGVDVLTIENGTGKVGIGDTTPDYGLDVVADINSDDCFREAGAQIAGTCASDIRLKKNIKSLNGSLDIINQLNPVSFEWRDENLIDTPYVPGIQAGLIAQEVEKVLPHLVKDKEYGYKAVRYNLELQMRTIQAIKELKSEKDEEITELKSEVAELKALVCLDHPYAEFCA